MITNSSDQNQQLVSYSQYAQNLDHTQFQQTRQQQKYVPVEFQQAPDLFVSAPLQFSKLLAKRKELKMKQQMMERNADGSQKNNEGGTHLKHEPSQLQTQRKTQSNNSSGNTNHHHHHQTILASSFIFRAVGREQQGFKRYFRQEKSYEPRYYPQFDIVDANIPAYTIGKENRPRAISETPWLQNIQNQLSRSFEICEKNPLQKPIFFQNSDSMAKSSLYKRNISTSSPKHHHNHHHEMGGTQTEEIPMSSPIVHQAESPLKDLQPVTPRNIATPNSHNQNTGNVTATNYNMQTPSTFHTDSGCQRRVYSREMVNGSDLKQLEMDFSDNVNEVKTRKQQQWIQMHNQVPRSPFVPDCTDQPSDSRFQNFQINVPNPDNAHSFDSYTQRRVFQPKPHQPSYDLLKIDFNAYKPRNKVGYCTFFQYSDKIKTPLMAQNPLEFSQRLQFYDTEKAYQMLKSTNQQPNFHFDALKPRNQELFPHEPYIQQYIQKRMQRLPNFNPRKDIEIDFEPKPEQVQLKHLIDQATHMQQLITGDNTTTNTIKPTTPNNQTFDYNLFTNENSVRDFRVGNKHVDLNQTSPNFYN